MIKTQEHDLLYAGDVQNKERTDKQEGEGEDDVTDKTDFFRGRTGILWGSRSRIIAVQQA